MGPRIPGGKPAIRSDAAKLKGRTVAVRQSIRGQEPPWRKKAIDGRKADQEALGDEEPKPEQKEGAEGEE